MQREMAATPLKSERAFFVMIKKMEKKRDMGREREMTMKNTGKSTVAVELQLGRATTAGNCPD